MTREEAKNRLSIILNEFDLHYNEEWEIEELVEGIYSDFEKEKQKKYSHK